MAHYDVVFPKCIGFGSSATYQYAADLFEAVSGRSVTVSYWAQHKRAWNIATGIKTDEDFEQFLDFFHAFKGPENTFLFQDRFDKSSAAPGASITNLDQTLGTATASQTDFQLSKTRTKDGASTKYNVYRPDESTVVVAVDGAPQVVTTDYTIESGGIIRFVTPMTGGEVVTAGFEYNLKAQFGRAEFQVLAPNKTDGDTFYLQGTIPIFEVRE